MRFTHVAGISTLTDHLSLFHCSPAFNKTLPGFIWAITKHSCFQLDHYMVTQRSPKIVGEHTRCDIGFSVMNICHKTARGCHWNSVTSIIFQVRTSGQVATHPLELVSEKLTSMGVIYTLGAVAKIWQRITVAGVQQAAHRNRTAKGNILFLSFEDLQRTSGAILFPEVYRQSRSMISSTKAFLLTGVMEMDARRGEPFLRVEKFYQ